jgi:hypothetical protein
VLTKEETRQLLPSPDSHRLPESWDIPASVSTKLLTHFYPATENNDVSKNVFEKQALKATLLSVDKGVARVRLTGDMRMAHSFYHKPDGKKVEATVIGFLDFEPAAERITSLQLVTDEASYGGGHFAVALREAD